MKTLAEYLAELDSKKRDKPPQVKEGIEIYIDLWKKVVEKGVVTDSDEVDVALRKVDEAGGLYRAAE
jgi:hypothetical protein